MTGNTLAIISLIVALIGVGVATYSIVSAHRIKAWRKNFSESGELPDNLEDIVEATAKKIKALEISRVNTNKHVAELEDMLSFAVQKVGLIRFDSGASDGGNLSFCLALLDHHNNGFVLTSMHGRMQNRIYTKSIEGGNSETQLSDEEREAVFKAIGLHKPKPKPKARKPENN